jgi:shikimate kinase
MASCEKILIAGFSGAGKTTLLNELSKTAPSGWEHFDDLDQVILKNKGKGQPGLAQLINEVGWETFRLWERQELEGWLKKEGRGVLALGGGSLSPMVWELYKDLKKIKFCHLEVPFETCWQRLANSGEPRPLVLRGKVELQKIFDERKHLFDQIPWKIVSEEGQKGLVKKFWGEIAATS